MNFKNIIVTGANRGIGLEFVRQLLKQNPAPKNLIATTRKSSDELNNLKSGHTNLHVLNYDATNYDSYDAFVKQVSQIVADDGLDLLINNAGIYVRGGLDNLTPQGVLTNLDVNAVAPLVLTKALLPLLKVSAANRKTVVANITSQMGSIDDNSSGSHYAYRASKAALNMIGKSLAVDLAPSKIIIVSLHPGWVQTDMGGANALIDAPTSVSGMLNVIATSDQSKSGAFINYSGKQLPW